MATKKKSAGGGGGVGGPATPPGLSGLPTSGYGTPAGQAISHSGSSSPAGTPVVQRAVNAGTSLASGKYPAGQVGGATPNPNSPGVYNHDQQYAPGWVWQDGRWQDPQSPTFGQPTPIGSAATQALTQNLSNPTLPPGYTPPTPTGYQDPFAAKPGLSNPVLPPSATTQLQGLTQQPPAAGAAPVATSPYKVNKVTTSQTPVNGALTPSAFQPPAANPGAPVSLQPSAQVTAANPWGLTPAQLGQTVQQYPVAPPAGSDPYGTSAATQLYNATWGPNGPISQAKTLTDTNNQVDQNLGSNLQAENGLISGYQSFNTGLGDIGNAATQTANQQLGAAQGTYNTNLNTLNGMSVGNYGQLASTLGGEQVLTPTAYQGDWTSNAQDVGREQSSYDTLAGVGGGSLDYTAQQATLTQAQLYQAALTLAQSNGTDVNAEYASLQKLNNVANGSLNVTNGQDSPEALAAQKSALSQLSALTNPQRTAQEEFLYEQQRGQEEQQERSSRAAVMQNLRERGMSGSGMELTNQLGSDQINSQNRLLGDLGTQATAVGRATTDLQNYATLGSNMNAQGNAVAQGNQSVMAGGATAAGQLASNIRGQSDNMALNNAGFANANAQFNANAGNQNSQFNAGQANQTSQFNAGQVNNASANNQQTRLTGDVNAGQVAVSMRNASDAVGLANKNQQGITNRANDQFNLQSQEDLTGRAIATNNAGNTAIGQLGTNNDNYLRTNQGTTQTQLGNTQGQLNADSTLGDKNYNAGQKGVADTTNYWGTVGNNAVTNLNGSIGAIGAAGGPTGQLIGTSQVATGAQGANGATGSLNGQQGIYPAPTPYVPSTTSYVPTANPIPTSAASQLNAKSGGSGAGFGSTDPNDPWRTI